MQRFPLRFWLWLALAATILPLSARPPADAVVVFNELQYHPLPGGASWIELHNQMGVNVDLSGWKLTGGVNYTFPNGTVIPGKGFLVIADTPSALPGSLGPWNGILANDGETVTLRDRNERLLDEISYNDNAPWPVAADGSGHSLAKRREDLAGFTPEHWLASATMGGTPGAVNFPAGEPGVTLAWNEVAGSNAPAGAFFIEIVNRTPTAVDLTNVAVVTSSGQQVLLAGSLAAGGLLALSETTLGFRPAAGAVWFLKSSAAGPMLDAVRQKITPQARDHKARLQQPDVPTPGLPNVITTSNAIVINEIMYHHQPTFLPTGVTTDAEEWIELCNRSATAVDLTDWQLDGGIHFAFPAGTLLAPGAYLVVAKDATLLKTRFPALTALGNFSGSLSNQGDTVQLLDARQNTVNEVQYHHAGRWDERADGGGSSLELRQPDANNSIPESWLASDESAKSTWQTFTYQGTGANPTGSINPTQWNEFVCGLLGRGEFLLDDVSVLEGVSGNLQLMQNGNFNDGTANKWRLLGTHGDHGLSVVTVDPSAPGNNVLRVVATDETEPVYNHLETTLKNGASFVTLSDTKTYSISFRARWISGCPRLSTRLYFNRLSRQSLLPVPMQNGTPGAPNSRLVTNLGPTFQNLTQSPTLPAANVPVQIKVSVSDPQNVAQSTLSWRTDGGAWQTQLMTITDGMAAGQLPGQAAGTLVQFYVSATDTLGATSTFPAAGADSRALVKWLDASTPAGPGHGFRILMLTSDVNDLHDTFKAASNLVRPCTLIYREWESFLNAGLRLKSSLFGRTASVRLGYSLTFDPLQPFRGQYEGINLDRSGYGRGTDNSSRGISEIINWAVFNRAGGVPSMYNDLVSVLAPRAAENGPAVLTMAEFNDTYLDSQFENGADQPVFRYDRLYYPTSATGTVEDPKPASPNANTKVSLRSLDTPMDKENYRWNFPITNARNADDFSRFINLNQTFRLTGAPYLAAVPQAIDIDQWLRASAAMTLVGVGDNYASDALGFYRQNLKLYARADGRILYLPWDTDFLTEPFNASIIDNLNFDTKNLIAADPRWERLFYGHLHSILRSAFNVTYLSPWIAHYQTFSNVANWNDVLTYTTQRNAYVTGEINTRFPFTPFAFTTNGGADFAAPGPFVTLTGDGWIDVRTISLAGAANPLNVIWLDRSRWQVQVPITFGANPIALEARNDQGELVGSDTLTIQGTGGVTPAQAGNLVIAEIHYHPADPSPAEQAVGFSDGEDFEFIELRNISATAITLTGCRFTKGIVYHFASNTELAAGESLVVPRRTAAFALRAPGVTSAAQYYEPGSNFLSNGGEELILTDAAGRDIQRFNYQDRAPWPTSADGNGPSLVLIAPQTNPDPAQPLNWRASREADGNPGTTDAMPPIVDPSGDSNANGIPNLIERVIPGGLAPGELSVSANFFVLRCKRQSWLEAGLIIEVSPDLLQWQSTTGELTAREPQPKGLEMLTLQFPRDSTRKYYRARVSQ